MYWKQFFSFRVPIIYHVDHLDVVIEDKALLLLSWKFKHRYKLAIPELHKTYRSRESTVILKLPSNITRVEIIISTFWKKRNYSVMLRRSKLTQEVAQHIIQQLKPLKVPIVEIETIKMNLKNLFLTVPIPFLTKSHLKVRSTTPITISEAFTYPN